MIEAPRLTTKGEAEWEVFRRHVEWSEHFSLFFLFCSSARLEDVYFKRLDDLFRFRIAPSERLTPSHPATAAEEILGWVRRYPKDADYRSPIWLDLSRDHDPAWSEARANLLARLNEHREVLRNTLNGPLIIVLPADYRPRLQEIAPDLWSIRQYSLELRGEEHLAPADPQTPPVSERVAVENPPAAAPEEDGSLEDYGLPTVIEWKRLRARGATGRDTLLAGEAAFEAAFAERRLDTARRIAADLVNLSRTAQADSDTPGAVRDLSVSLNNLGRVAVALGRFEDADTAYRESLDLSRTLRVALGDNLQTIRDLAITLTNVGDLLTVQNRPAAARPYCAEALTLWQRLARAFPDNPEFPAQVERLQTRLAAQTA